MDAAGFRQLARRQFALAMQGSEPDGDFHMNPEFRDILTLNATRPAAVLIPIVERRDGLMLVLTKRREQMRSHAGQVAFPGGKIDPEDASPEAAALREAQEEIGLDPAHAEVLGRMPDYYTGSGYCIAPVVALIDSGTQFTANEAEVDYVFETPLAFLLDTANHRTGSREWEGKRRFYLEMPYGEHYIWGVTAGIIRVFRDRLLS